MKIIAITSAIEEKKNTLSIAYINAFNKENIVPLIIPTFTDEITDFLTENKKELYKKKAEEIEKKCDALILSGGGDINPINYDEPNFSSFYCNTRRDLSETYLIKRFIEAKKPIMGICRGMQILGIELGLNNFYQDLGETEELHSGTSRELSGRKEPSHTIETHGALELYLKTKGLMTKDIPVNSMHHQGFILSKEKNNTINILANTSKVIEAFEHKTLPIFAVQWHPEEYENSTIIHYFIEKYLNK